jgi:hypothetical protein
LQPMVRLLERVAAAKENVHSPVLIQPGRKELNM